MKKQLWIRQTSPNLKTADGKTYPDHAAPAVDAERYLQAFSPEKRASVKADALREELKIPPGKSYTGYAVFSYPVNQPPFHPRNSFTFRIPLYTHPAVILKHP